MNLFGVAGHIKPGGSKWMVASKVLYHLLPDLAVPMYSGYTAPFFGCANLRFPLSDEFVVRAYSAFEVVAKSASSPLKSLADRYEPRLALARVIDFGIVGYVYQEGSVQRNP